MIELPLGFIAKINESGTHIHKDFLKVRVDIYPPIGSKTYSLHYVDHYDREPTEEELADKDLLDKVPKHKELNPCLCHFMKVSPEDTKKQLEDMAKVVFNASTLSRLDDSLSGSIEKVPDIMKARGGTGRKISKKEKSPMLIARINARFREV